MAVVTMKNLLESGVHFGHQTRRWNPKMAKYIYTSRNGIHIIDLQATIGAIKKAYEVAREVAQQGKPILFVGTKKQAQQAIQREAERCEMFYVNNRWAGGMLTNFETIKKSIHKLKQIERMENDGTFDSLTKKEVSLLMKEKGRLEKDYGGIKNMKELPGAVFVVDTRKEALAVVEANKMNIPVIAVVDTNCDPTNVDYPIPGNDDAIRAITLFISVISNAVLDADTDASFEVIETMDDEDGIDNPMTEPRKAPKAKEVVTPVEDDEDTSDEKVVAEPVAAEFDSEADFSNYEPPKEEKEALTDEIVEEDKEVVKLVDEETLYQDN